MPTTSHRYDAQPATIRAGGGSRPFRTASRSAVIDPGPAAGLVILLPQRRADLLGKAATHFVRNTSLRGNFSKTEAF
jgi:hypothetical protein